MGVDHFRHKGNIIFVANGHAVCMSRVCGKQTGYVHTMPTDSCVSCLLTGFAESADLFPTVSLTSIHVQFVRSMMRFA